MLSRSLIAFGLVAFSAKIAVAAPPACLLAAVNTEPNPSDLATICGPDASKVQDQIKSLCGANSDTAMTAFSSICSSAGGKAATHKLVTAAANPSPTLDAAQVSITHSTSTLKPVQFVPTTLLMATGGPPPMGSANITMGTGPVITAPTVPGTSGTGSPGYQNAAGRVVDAQSFTALALAAAGLAIFL